MNYKRIAVIMLIAMSMVGCKKKEKPTLVLPTAQVQAQPQVQKQPAPPKEEAPEAEVDEVTTGRDGVLHTSDNHPDEWNLPAGEKFVTMLMSSDSNFVVTSAGTINKVYKMFPDGHLGLGYVFHQKVKK